MSNDPLVVERDALRTELDRMRGLVDAMKADFAEAVKLVTDENRALRTRIADLERERLMLYATIGRACSCGKPTNVRLQWSDRESHTCFGCLPDRIVNISLDHCYDRGDIRPMADGIGIPTSDAEAIVERACAAARAYLDEIAPGWRTRTVNLYRGDPRWTELLSRCRAEVEKR